MDESEAEKEVRRLRKLKEAESRLKRPVVPSMPRLSHGYQGEYLHAQPKYSGVPSATKAPVLNSSSS